MDTSLAARDRGQAQRAVKRIIDLAGAAVALAICAPLFLAIALLIELESPGQVLFRQARIGADGRRFTLLKFRTMHACAGERLQEALERSPALRMEFSERQKLVDDPRITRVGRLLRRCSLDELPQLWNVMVGDMSLVGPRPFLPEQSGLYGPAIHFYRQVRPGLTGLWQVSGRNELSFRERVELDVAYVVRWSPWLDLAILLRTPWVVLTQRGAY
jgi:lipopolysaccharide/colanic/teichoic acid biosynthesis glycosyltransferase